MNFFHKVFGPRPPNAGKSWRPLWVPVFVVLFWIFPFAYKAKVENDSANRQQTSFGTTTQCEPRGRGNYCHYMFPVGDTQYVSVHEAEPGVVYGQTVVVYYDTEDPRVNALEDFGQQSRRNRRFVYISLFVLAATVAFTLWDRAPHGKTSDERTP